MCVRILVNGDLVTTTGTGKGLNSRLFELSFPIECNLIAWCFWLIFYWPRDVIAYQIKCLFRWMFQTKG